MGLEGECNHLTYLSLKSVSGVCGTQLVFFGCHCARSLLAAAAARTAIVDNVVLPLLLAAGAAMGPVIRRFISLGLNRVWLSSGDVAYRQGGWKREGNLG